MSIGRNDFNAKLVSFFFNRIRLVILILVTISIGGVFSLLTLTRQGFPQVQVKVVAVTTVLPGASSTEVESQVTKVIENSLKDVKNLQDISSTSQNNISNIIVSLKQSANLDNSVQEIQSKVSGVTGELPQDAQKPTVNTFNATGGTDFILGVTTDDNFSVLKSETDKLASELTQVKGIKEVKETLNHSNRLVITYDPVKLAVYKLSPFLIEQIIKGSNLDFPITTLDLDGKSQSLIAAGSYKNIQDIKDQIIGSDGEGGLIYIKDVASITEQVDGTESFNRIGVKDDDKLVNKPALLLGVKITTDTDIVSDKANIDKKIQQLKDENVISSSTNVYYLFDQAKATNRQVGEIVSGAFGNKQNLFILGGIQLVVLAMFVFVNWRAALIAALAIPLSFLFTLLWLYLAHINLNTIVLFSLILVLGLIVDPAIVILEAIQRYKDLGRNGREAVTETAQRYASGLFIAVLTSVIVFVPFGIVSGVFGEIIKYIPATVIPALIASYLIPVAILPILGAKILKTKTHIDRTASETKELWPAAVWMMNFNRWVLNSFWRKILILIFVVGLIFMSLQLVVKGNIQVVQFSSPEDTENLQMSLAFPKGTTFSAKDEIAKTIENKISSKIGVDSYFYFQQDSDSAVIFINLSDDRDKEHTSKRILSRIIKDTNKIKGVDIFLTEISVGPPSSEYQIQVQLYDNDLDNLREAAITVGDFLRAKREVVKVDDSFTGRGDPKLNIVFNKTKLAEQGLTVAQITTQLKGFLEEKKVSKFTDLNNDKDLEIYLTSDKNSLPTTKTDLEKLTVAGANGQLIALTSIATIEQISSIDQIQRFNSLRFVNVRAKVRDSSQIASVQKDLDSYLTDSKLKELGLSSRANKGELEDIAQSFRELFIALIASIFLTYLVLVLQFNSFSQPLIMLFTIPLALIGVFPALVLAKGQLGFLEILGLTILVGIVENVAIFLIDYANQLVREKNLSLKEAIIQSSGVRFRPIILTKVVALGGLLPLMIESPFWRGLSSVIIGGILVSGFLSLTIIPIFYTWFGAVRAKVYRSK